jgi:hypothetical protein
MTRPGASLKERIAHLPRVPRPGPAVGHVLEEPWEDPQPNPLYDGPIYPDNGYPPRRGENRPGLSPWGRFSKQGSPGKSSIIVYNGTDNGDQVASVQVLQLEGDDADACQCCITLLPPRVSTIEYALLQTDPQNLTTTLDSNEVPTGVFPGTALPIAWPPFEAVIEWGIGGARARAYVDFLNGTTLNVIASFVRVYGAVAQGPGVDLANTSAAYQLSAFVGPGWTKTGTAQKTVFVGEIANEASSAVVTVPPFARRVTIAGAAVPPNITVGYITFSQSPDGTNPVGSFIVNGNQPNTFPVPAAGQYFSLFNQTGALIQMAAIFELSI